LVIRNLSAARVAQEIAVANVSIYDMLSNQVCAPLSLVPAAKCPSYPLGFLKKNCHRQYQFCLTAFLPAPRVQISEKNHRLDFSNAWLLWRPLGNTSAATTAQRTKKRRRKPQAGSTGSAGVPVLSR
jgi:hypothetical protein